MENVSRYTFQKFKDGFFAEPKQLEAAASLARKSKMDDWFGQIAEVRTTSGELIHVVWDRKDGRWTSLKDAVKKLDCMISNPRDFLESPGEVFWYETLIKDLGLSKDLYWYANAYGRTKDELNGLLNAISEEDGLQSRFRPMKIVRNRAKGSYVLHVSDGGEWRRSTFRWFCLRNHIAYEASFTLSVESPDISREASDENGNVFYDELKVEEVQEVG